jgi:hypothetical protein
MHKGYKINPGTKPYYFATIFLNPLIHDNPIPLKDPHPRGWHGTQAVASDFRYLDEVIALVSSI